MSRRISREELRLMYSLTLVDKDKSDLSKLLRYSSTTTFLNFLKRVPAATLEEATQQKVEDFFNTLRGFDVHLKEALELDQISGGRMSVLNHQPIEPPVPLTLVEKLKGLKADIAGIAEDDLDDIERILEAYLGTIKAQQALRNL